MAGEGLKYFTVVSWWDGLLLHAARVMPPKGTALRGVVLLVHGMSEHKERYAKTMRYLAAHGYACVIYDHRGHGHSVASRKDLGYMGPEGDQALISDAHQMLMETKKLFPAMPVHVLGHSMGSLIVRCLLQRWDHEMASLTVLGCVGGVLAAGAAAAVVGTITPMNGFNMQEAENLILYGADKGLRISGLLVCGVLISALGAVMDVALGIVSSMWEVKTQNPGLKARELFRSGMHVGSDAMGTMANPLLLAGAGSSRMMWILVPTDEIPFLQLVNTDYICLEILQSVAGSLGILLTVPLVALISAGMMSRTVKRTGV